MTDKKISELTSITGANVSDANDVLPIVDTSVATTKKITRAELFKSVSSVDINGGTIDGTVIGGSTPAAISGTTGTFSGTVTADGLTVEGTALEAVFAGSTSSKIHIKGDTSNSGDANEEDATLLMSTDNGAYHHRISALNGAGSAPMQFTHFNGIADNKTLTIGHNGDISFYEDTGTTPKFFWDASNEAAYFGQTTPVALADTSGSAIQIDAGTMNLKRTCTSSTQALMHLNNIGTTGNVMEFYVDGVQKGAIGVDTDAALTFVNGAGSGEAMRIDSSGNVLCGSDGGGDIGSSTKRFKDLYLSGGVYLGGTGSANYLDDYEEGTWTPVYAGYTTAGTYTYSENQGVYTKIGNMVYATFNLTNVATSSAGSGAAMITGLPFTVSGYPSGFNVNTGIFDISYHGTSGLNTHLATSSGQTFFFLQFTNALSVSTSIEVTDKTSNGADIRGLVIYQTT